MKKRMNVLLICIISLTMLLCSCGKSKSPISSADFKEIMEKEGYTLQEATDQFGEGELEECWLAIKDTIQIEFYVCNSVGDARTAYENNKNSAEGDAGIEKEVSLKNFSKYTTTHDGSYYVISRIEKTFIYLNVMEEEKEEVRGILKEIGY